MVIELKSACATAKVDTKGAELVSFTDVFGTEYMWQKDPKYWARTSPVLFPIVGNLKDDKTMIEGKEYHMAKHGFCRDAEFRVSYQAADSVILSYSASEETLAQYPYRFCLTLAYRLEEAVLSIRYTVMNLDDKPIDYCLGAHPAFNVPVDGNGSFEEYYLEFNEPETAHLPIYDFEKSEINLENRVTRLENERRLPLRYGYFDNDAMVFEALRSNSVKLASVRTGRGVEVGFEGFESLAFWTPIKMEAPFLCVEPWCGMAARSGESGEFTGKYGVQHLDVEEHKDYLLTIRPV